MTALYVPMECIATKDSSRANVMLVISVTSVLKVGVMKIRFAQQVIIALQEPYYQLDVHQLFSGLAQVQKISPTASLAKLVITVLTTIVCLEFVLKVTSVQKRQRSQSLVGLELIILTKNKEPHQIVLSALLVLVALREA